jgi:uroporphyrinogen-III synthase
MGANVIEAPTIELAANRRRRGGRDDALRSIMAGRYDWVVFTSANGVRQTKRRLLELGLDARAFGQNESSPRSAERHGRRDSARSSPLRAI